MRLLRVTCVAVLALLALLPAGGSGAAAASAPAASVVCHLHDDRIDEASGLARGIASPHIIYAQNDSGDTHRFFALDARTCATVATVTVPGASSVDWEDIAVAPDRRGTPSVWLADIGDNGAVRAEVAVYRIDEPRIRPGQRQTAIRAAAPDVWRLRYPGGPIDAESLAVGPRGVGYLVTKSYVGASTVYRLPAGPDARRVQQLTRVGAVQFAPSSLTSLEATAREVAATSAAISRDGAKLVVRTYTDAYLWTVRDDDVGAALRSAPIRVVLPDQPQGEGVAFDGDRLLLDSEHRGSAVYSVPLPVQGDAVAGTAPSAAASPAPSESSGRSSGSSSAAPASTPASGATGTGTGGSGGNGSWLPGLIVLSLVVLGAAGWWTLQLRGRAGR